MIQVIGIQIRSDREPFFANQLLAHKLTELRPNVSLEQSMLEKSIIAFGILMTCYH